MESIMDVLRAWNKSTPERVKLQHVYIAIIIAVTVVFQKYITAVAICYKHLFTEASVKPVG